MTKPSAPMGLPSLRALLSAFPLLLRLMLIIVSVTPGTLMAAPLSELGQENPFSPGQVGVCIQSGSNAGKLSEAARKQLPAARELEVGEWRIIGEVCPREKFFPTSVVLTPGASYVISAVGRWKDLWIRTGPEGWWFPPFHPFNRIPWHRMFVLSGSIGPSLEHAFVIGRQTTWTAPMVLPEGIGAELMLFPNDLESMYYNNRSLAPAQGGPMRVTILRQS